MLVRFDLIARALPLRPPFPIEIGRIFRSRFHIRAGPLAELDQGQEPVVYFGFFGPRFFSLGPDRPAGSASSPRHGQESLNASKARVMPGTSNRSGFWSRCRNRTLALSKTLPCAGGHPRTSGGRFGEKDMAVSIMPSHAPADRASP